MENSDMYDKITSLFPYMVIGTCAILFVIMGFVFQSIFIPLRGILTIGLSTCWAFGITVIIFEKILDTKIFWFTKVLAFPIVVGLGLDYDIFLLSRIYEYKLSGFTTRASIVKGSYLTGSIITGAGTLMMIAFLSLNTTHIQTVYQFAVVLSSAVFIDTFCIRTALVPAIMRLASWINWWPSPMGSSAYEDQPNLYTEDNFLDDNDDIPLNSPPNLYVQPHTAHGYQDRSQRISRILSQGMPSFYSKLTCLTKH